MGFEGIVVTDAINMGGFAGWYDTKEQAEIESFKAGCDMMLWPTANYPDNLEKAILSGEVPMERLDDAVRRILRVKERKGLFEEGREAFRPISEEDAAFVKDVQRRCANQSMTLIRDRMGHFPLDPKKTPKIGVSVIAEHPPVKKEAAAIREALEKRGFTVEYVEEDNVSLDETVAFYERNDLILYTAFSRSFRPIGFLDFTGPRAKKIQNMLVPDYAVDKVVVANFGSPYMVNQYFQKVQTCVNGYSMLACSVEAFVRAACGEIEFTGKTPVQLFYCE